MFEKSLYMYMEMLCPWFNWYVNAVSDYTGTKGGLDKPQLGTEVRRKFKQATIGSEYDAINLWFLVVSSSKDK